MAIMDTARETAAEDVAEVRITAFMSRIQLVGPRRKAATNTAVISGPSGVGKGTLINKLMKEYPDKFGFAVSHTTRMPREGETDAVHYHFTTRKIMEEDIQQGRFLESADVHGNLYGTSIAAVDAMAQAGKVAHK